MVTIYHFTVKFQSIYLQTKIKILKFVFKKEGYRNYPS